MPNRCGNKKPSQVAIVIKGTLISASAAIVLCAMTAYLIIKEHIPAAWTQLSVMMTLMVSSFLGAKYSDLSARENRPNIALITGAAFILLLIMIEISIPGKGADKILLKAAASVAGTVFGAINGSQKGKGSAQRKHRRNR